MLSTTNYIIAIVDQAPLSPPKINSQKKKKKTVYAVKTRILEPKI